MSSLIRRRFSALARHMDLEVSPGPLVLQDEVVPVVLVHTHCDELVISSGTVLTGVGSITNYSPLATLPGLPAGTYLIQVTVSWSIIVAAFETLALTMEHGTTGATLMTLGYIVFGTANNQGGVHSFERLVSVPDDVRFVLTSSTLAASDNLAVVMTVQCM